MATETTRTPAAASQPRASRWRATDPGRRRSPRQVSVDAADLEVALYHHVFCYCGGELHASYICPNHNFEARARAAARIRAALPGLRCQPDRR